MIENKNLLRYWVGLEHLVQLVKVPFLQKTVCPMRLTFSSMLSVGHSGQYQLVGVRTNGICKYAIQTLCFMWGRQKLRSSYILVMASPSASIFLPPVDQPTKYPFEHKGQV